MDYRIYDLEQAIKSAKMDKETIRTIQLLPTTAEWFLKQAEAIEQIEFLMGCRNNDGQATEQIREILYTLKG